MIINDIAIIASDTARTKAYIQMMCKEGFLPGACIVYTDDIKKMQEEADKYIDSETESTFFTLEAPVLYTIKKYNINFSIVENRDINSDEMQKAIYGLEQKYIIYSGYGGSILKAHLFNLGKKYIHVHAGVLPCYRGSTTAYYSIIQENNIGATAIFLSEGIDEGEIITSEVFERPAKGTNIDTLYEPYLRSLVLKKAIELYLEQGIFKSVKQSSNDAQTYYIIHPVLKHLALMSNK